MENKASARVASRAIGTGSQFNSSKAMITRGNCNKAPQVPYTISKHIYEAIRDAESKLNLSSPAEGTNLANKEYEHNPSDSMKNRPCNVSREDETHLPRQVWMQQWTKEDSQNQPWHGLAMDGMAPDARSCKSLVSKGKDSSSGQFTLCTAPPSSGSDKPEA
jgi:hypothetical protein